MEVPYRSLKLAYDLAGQLDVGNLVLTDGNQICGLQNVMSAVWLTG